MAKINLSVASRSLKIKPQKIRKEKMIPANIIGMGEKGEVKSLPIKFSINDFSEVYQEAGDTNIIYLKVKEKGKKKASEIPSMIEEVQNDVITEDVIHVMFKKINLDEKITAEIPVETIGEFKVPEAVLVTVRNTIEVEALPTDLPEKFVIDVSKFNEIGDQVTLADLEYDENKVELIIGEEGKEAPVVLVQKMKEEVVEEEEETLEEILEGAEVPEGQEGEVAEGSEKDQIPEDQEGDKGQEQEK